MDGKKIPNKIVIRHWSLVIGKEVEELLIGSPRRGVVEICGNSWAVKNWVDFVTEFLKIGLTLCLNSSKIALTLLHKIIKIGLTL